MRDKAVRAGWRGLLRAGVALSAALCTGLMAATGAADVQVRRNVAYADARDTVLDVFVPAGTATSSHPPLPVLLFAPPAAGRGSHDENVARWAAHHQMIGILMHRRDDARAWERGPQDFGAALSWLQANARSQGGDPQRVTALGVGAGGAALLNYLAHSRYWCCRAPGLAGAAIIGAQVNLTHPQPEAAPQHRTRAAEEDTARSDQPGLVDLFLPLLIGAPLRATQAQQRSVIQLQQELCRAGHCPTVRFLQQSDNAAVLRSFDTADDSSTRQLLAWISSRH